jgi:hypothetical protein
LFNTLILFGKNSAVDELWIIFGICGNHSKKLFFVIWNNKKNNPVMYKKKGNTAFFVSLMKRKNYSRGI